MPFLSSLVYTSTRVGGQRERQTQAFETGIAYFPRDFPFTDTYASYVAEREAEDRGRWERKPPAKRANFEKLGTRSAWKPDWEVVLGIETPGDGNCEEAGMVTTQREPMSTSATSKKIHPWLLRGPDVVRILDEAASMFNHGSGLFAEINKLRQKRLQDPLANSVRSEDLWKGALVTVRLILCGRGAPDDMAIIYSLQDDEVKKWDQVFNQRRRSSAVVADEESLDEVRVSRSLPIYECTPKQIYL